MDAFEHTLSAPSLLQKQVPDCMGLIGVLEKLYIHAKEPNLSIYRYRSPTHIVYGYRYTVYENSNTLELKHRLQVLFCSLFNLTDFYCSPLLRLNVCFKTNLALCECTTMPFNVVDFQDKWKAPFKSQLSRKLDGKWETIQIIYRIPLNPRNKKKAIGNTDISTRHSS